MEPALALYCNVYFQTFFFFWWKSYQKYASRTQEYASNQQKLGAGNIHGILIPTFPITANNLSENQVFILGFPAMDADWSSLSPKIDVAAWENERFSITCCFTSARYNGRKKALFFHAFAKKMHDGTKRKMQHRNYQEVPKNVPDADTRSILTTNYITCSAKLRLFRYWAPAAVHQITAPAVTFYYKSGFKKDVFGSSVNRSINLTC